MWVGNWPKENFLPRALVDIAISKISNLHDSDILSFESIYSVLWLYSQYIMTILDFLSQLAPCMSMGN